MGKRRWCCFKSKSNHSRPGIIGQLVSSVQVRLHSHGSRDFEHGRVPRAVTVEMINSLCLDKPFAPDFLDADEMYDYIHCQIHLGDKSRK